MAHQTGYIWRKGNGWFGRWREDVIANGQVKRTQRSRRLADYGDRYRCEKDVRPLLDDILRPLNNGKTSSRSTLPLVEFVQGYYLPFVEENYKPSTLVGYRKIWKKYLSPRLAKMVLRDFRTVDAARLLADIHRERNVGRTMLKHIKAFLSGVFTYAKNEGVLDGVNPVQDAMIPKKAAPPKETHAATPDEVLAIMDVLVKAGEKKACAAVALMFFAGLRPGEARGVEWQDYDGSRLFVRRSIWRVWTTSPKTESSVKPVPVIEPLTSILTDLRQADGNPSSGPILRGPSGKPLDLDNLAERVVRPVLRNAGIPWYTWYSFRRGVSTTVRALSKDSLASKGLLRHSSVSTTERHYIKDVPENTLAAMKQLESLCNIRATEGNAKPN